MHGYLSIGYSFARCRLSGISSRQGRGGFAEEMDALMTREAEGR